MVCMADRFWVAAPFEGIFARSEELQVDTDTIVHWTCLFKSITPGLEESPRN
jgi:hypothetical protein